LQVFFHRKINRARIKICEERKLIFTSNTKEILKELIKIKQFKNALEVADSSRENRVENIKFVICEMVKTIMKGKSEDLFSLLECDKKGTLYDPEGSESPLSSCWTKLQKILIKYRNLLEISESVANTILWCNPKYEIPQFLDINVVILTHVYLNYGRIFDAAKTILKGIEKGIYVDAILYAKVMENLKNIERDGEENEKREAKKLFEIFAKKNNA